MKLFATALLSGALLLTAGFARADDGGDKAKDVGKTVSHGTTSVGKGASKIFHDAARGVHKVIAKNTDDPHKKAVHLRKADKQHQWAAEKAHQSKHEMHKAGNAADNVGK
jgi:hypothetical protein